MSKTYDTKGMLTDLKLQIAFGKERIDVEMGYFKNLYDSCGNIVLDKEGVTLGRLMQDARMVYTDITIPCNAAVKIIENFEGLAAA
jgi:hypothetical protein